MKKADIFEFYRRLAEDNPSPETELEYGNDYQLLVAVVLSAQATDVGVNKVTPVLFARWPTPQALAEADRAELAEVLRPTGLLRNHAAALQRLPPRTPDNYATKGHSGHDDTAKRGGGASERGFGKPPVSNREGGSIPVVATFQEELGLPCVLFGVGLPDENAHAPNEHLDLENFQNGIVASAVLYSEIAKLNLGSELPKEA